MTEITAKIDWPKLILAIAIAPFIGNAAVLILTIFYPPALFFGLIVGVASLMLGCLSYLILGGPLMVAAHALGINQPLLHGMIGYGAVWLLPFANAAGVPYIAPPEAVTSGQWFAPLWCATAAYLYNVLCRDFDLPERAPS